MSWDWLSFFIGAAAGVALLWIVAWCLLFAFTGLTGDEEDE